MGLGKECQRKIPLLDYQIVYSNLLTQKKMYVGGIFCDLAKVFHCVNHEILLAKLHFYGIQGVSEYWFRSYVTNRRQKDEVTSPNSTTIFFL
jgi:hypothetical protein